MVEVNRKTKETDIKCKIDINGCGKSDIKTPKFYNQAVSQKLCPFISPVP